MPPASKLIEFSFERPTDVTHLGRRVKVLAALAELPQKQRADLSKAVTEVCRYMMARGSTGRVAFSLADHEGQQCLEVTVRDSGASQQDSQRPLASKTMNAESTSLQRMGEFVDFFELTGAPGTGALARMRQMLSPDFNLPSLAESRLWTRMVQQKTLEDAILVARQRGQLVEADADQLRQRQQLRDELETGTTDEDSRTLFSLIATATANLIAMLDADARITWVNDAFCRLTGYAADSVRTHRIDELLAGGDTCQSGLRDLREALRLGHKIADELLFYRQDGRPFWAHITFTPVKNRSGKVARWIAIGDDVTQKRQTVDALAAAKEAAEAASRSKSEFLANMSHEIRTPLNAVIGMTELAMGTELTAEQREYLTTVKISAESLLELLNDILDLSKIETGKLTVEEVDFNLADLLRDTARALAVRAHVKGLELACHLPLEVPQFLRGDPVRLRQILVNLISNAIKFTEDGEVVVECEKQWQDEDEIGLHFSVRDTGIGVPREKLEQIFEAFEQADTSTSRQYGGTGLGLTITAELLRLMGGRIWVDSSPGQGSTFHFSLRFPVIKSPPPQIVRPEASQLEGMQVLAVDDNTTNRRILEELLTNWKMRPTLVSNAADAIKLLEQAMAEDRKYELVLLDAMMPRVDGFSLAEQVQSRPDLNCGTIMMLSSADRPDSAARCRELGITSYLTKPISASALLDSILTALGTAQQTDNELVDPPSSNGDGAPARPLKILVADDHEANRKLAIRMLEKRGHSCLTAADGNEVFRRLQDEHVDVVLMDVQMPGCDGYQATAAIRQREHETGTHLPIIALTAHAMKGDREKCLAAGMDAYLSKPLRPTELIALVESVAADGRNLPPTRELETPPSEQIDFDSVLERLEDDREMLIEQMQYFQRDGLELMSQITSAIERRGADALKFSSHRLKGLLAGFHRSRAAELCQRLEQCAADTDFENAASVSHQLEHEVQELLHAIDSFLQHEEE